jgi:hypothetical protein
MSMMRRILRLLNQRAFFLGCFAGALLYVVGTVQEDCTEYCQRCGLTRTEDGKSWFGIPLSRRVRSHPHEFTVLFRQYVSPRCEHRWLIWAGSARGLLGVSERACGHHSLWLRPSNEDALRPLEHFPDRSAVITVLASVDLTQNTVRDYELLAALQELPRVPSDAQAMKWVARHQELFGDGLGSGRDSDRQRQGYQ